MSSNRRDPNKMAPNELRILWGALEEKLESREELLKERVRELELAYIRLNQREQDITILKEELEAKRIELAGKDVELKHKKTNIKTRMLAGIVSVFFGVSSVLFNYANSLMTASTPDPNGNMILGIAAIIYIGCVVVTVLILGGGN